jgi:methyltransferase (TIGR00027 family)
MGPTALVAVEQHFPKAQRLLEDQFARRMLPPLAQPFLWLAQFAWARNWMVRVTEKDGPGFWGSVLCRKRYIDERVVASVGEIQAVVILGSGFDMRPFRIPALSEVPVWEIDQPENIEPKRKRLRSTFGTIPANLTLFAMDFDHQDLNAALASHGYSIDRRTFFIWEAVTQYITEKAVRTTLALLAASPPGSRLAFTYVRKDFLDGANLYGWERLYNRFVTTKVWIFGMNPEDWPAFLQPYGWRIVEDLGYGTLAEKYVRPTGRQLATTPVERIIYAEKL